MEKPARRNPATLLRSVGADTDVRRVADEAVLAWQKVDASLSPIVGKLGFAALYQRSVQQRRAADPWLAAAHEQVPLTADFAALHAALLSQLSAGRASQAQLALMTSFHDLLISLVGEPLTVRLLGYLPDTHLLATSLLATATRGPSAQDTLP